MICTTILTKEKKWYVARCLELGVTSQGKTVEEAQMNLKEAAELYLEDAPKRREIMSSVGFPMVTTLEIAYG